MQVYLKPFAGVLEQRFKKNVPIGDPVGLNFRIDNGYLVRVSIWLRYNK